MTDSTSGSSNKSIRLGLCLGALGVVYGDIGTSPLYTMRECLHHLKGMDRADGVLGILSLMFWTVMIVVNLKYLLFVTRADNRGEGGIFALLALSHTGAPAKKNSRRIVGFSTFIVLCGAALLYGDGVITPAISVLSAAEGLATFNPDLQTKIVPIAVVILAFVFFVQSKGTETIGRIFGPVMLIWFTTLGIFGAWHIFDAPEVFRALDPTLGVSFLLTQPWEITAGILGSIVLTVTGAEALYADMGHFGRKYIAQAWLFLVWPGLLLNYFGQGAYVLANPLDQTNPFFALAPEGGLRLFLVGLSICAAVIASQALITGTYSLTRQAIQLGYFPRLRIRHTNAEHAGQIYISLINTALAIGSIWVVLEFKTSADLAAAYGIAVTGTMTVTTFALYLVTRRYWKWPLWKSLSLCGAFMVFDLIFLGANLHKFTDGGWLPVVIGLGILAIMHTWKSGRSEIQEKVYGGAITELELTDIVKSESIVRVQGSAVFMVATPSGTPLALLHHLKANKCLQKTVVLLTISTWEVPQVEDSERLSVEELGEGIWRAVGRYGYMESPDVNNLVTRVAERGVPIKPMSTTYFFNREMIITGGNARMWQWQKSLYAFLSRNATPVKDYYQILPTQIIEIGLPVQL
ncbi:potassium transporter [Nibricoccus aquaticus]|uniref:Probable potassium transport system protein Kup n=1 Tax=Nibricoccus aquaticus TaxID=2576891 RepID=A0A290Q1L4_9BACT|nr:KUP/HAK/KT family potassium transporter [Nibricoccus aquaticus]ATC62545.1 potassium transporter [Nibricoccus aquaticus]